MIRAKTQSDSESQDSNKSNFSIKIDSIKIAWNDTCNETLEMNQSKIKASSTYENISMPNLTKIKKIPVVKESVRLNFLTFLHLRPKNLYIFH